jgi:urease accessory protein UreH
MEGLARCSRPFAMPSGGARLVTMQLGPGYVRGDRFACAGRVGARAELTMSPQAATRALGRGDESLATARWHVGAGATLRLLGEPLVLYSGTRHRAETEIELEPEATLVYLDVVVASGEFESVTTRLRVHTGERLLLHDALSLTPERLHGAVGSAFVVGGTLARSTEAASFAAADVAAHAASLRFDVRIGVGRPACGGLSVRARGDRAASVHAALAAVLACGAGDRITDLSRFADRPLAARTA